jgi:cell fate regulator YaaT (PSP1 superfamily)
MGCKGCTVCTTDSGSPKGCKSNGGCSTGGCNRLNTYDWLSSKDIRDSEPFDVVEVSFKNGARKSFFRNEPHTEVVTGDMAVVETGNGLDVGKITLSGELVRLQMRKKKVAGKDVMNAVIRRANERDLERLEEARSMEMPTMIRARAIARTLDLDMKIGDVEYQGDRRKATFYYTADGRVDFRELIRHFAKEFRVKIEMRQIGARQESARIGGLGSCGRELCCSTWLTDFKSVTTAAARYQNLAINQAKLSGMCGRLKCCLNYELDTYLDALGNFPKQAEKLATQAGLAVLVKTDIFKGIMYYSYKNENSRGKLYALDVDQVKNIKEMNDRGEKPVDLMSMQLVFETEEPETDYGDVTGFIELPEEKRRKKRKSRSNRSRRKPPQTKTSQDNKSKSGDVSNNESNAQDKKPEKEGKASPSKGKSNNKRRYNKNRRNNRRNNNKKD